MNETMLTLLWWPVCHIEWFHLVIAVSLSVRKIASLLIVLIAETHSVIDCKTACPRKQPTFGDATTGFSAKWSLRNERRNFILMTYHYPDLGSASDWSCREGNLVQPIDYPDLGSEASQYRISPLVGPRITKQTVFLRRLRTREPWNERSGAKATTESKTVTALKKKKNGKTSYCSSFAQQPSPLSKDRRRSPLLYLVRLFLRGGDGCA